MLEENAISMGNSKASGYIFYYFLLRVEDFVYRRCGGGEGLRDK